MKTLVIYHANCNDGFAAAAVVFSVLKDSADYIPLQYDQRDEFFDSKVWEGNHIYVLDFSFSAEQTAAMKEGTEAFVWLDHHETAIRPWLGETGFCYAEPNIRLDLNFCGAALTWMHFYRSPPPMFIDYIDDWDRWKFLFGETTRYFNAALGCEPRTLQHWSTLITDPNPKAIEEIIAKGKTLRTDHERRIKIMAEGKREIVIDGQTGYICNAHSQYASDLGNLLAIESESFGVTYFIDNDLTVRVSFRSVGSRDVSKIAQKFGGGGHKNAAGCTITLKELTEWLTS